MSKNEKNYPEPVVSVRTRKVNPGVVNKNKGIPVAPGLNLQDVPREYIVQHLRQGEQAWKAKFAQKHGNGVSMSF